MKTRKLFYAIAILFLGVLFQNCTHDVAPEIVIPVDPNQVAFDNADGIAGGKLFDKFWASETGWTAPTGINVSDITNYGNFYRCKQCHALDEKGQEGVYAGRAPKITRPEVGPSLIEPITNDNPITLFNNIKKGAADGAQVDPTRTADGTNTSLGGGDMPEFGKILTDAQIWDIVKFLKTERIDDTKIYDLTVTGTYPNATVQFSNIGKDGDAATGDAYYAANCASCHGADGLGGSVTITDEGDTVGVGIFGRNEPQSVQHRVKFGNPDTTMPAFSDITLQQMKDLLKALQNTTKYPDVPGLSQSELNQLAFDNADGIAGGKLFDKFWASETGWTAPTGINASDISDYGNFYRCKQCHALDQRGQEGVYAGRAPKISRPNVGPSLLEPIANDGIDEIFNSIKNASGRLVDTAKTQDGTDSSLGGDVMPNYGSILTDIQIWDIIKFLKSDRIDGSSIYDLTVSGTYPNATVTFSNIGKDGDAAAGDTYYAANCAACHGSNGLGGAFPITDEGATVGVGMFGRDEPQSVQHRVKFGNPGTVMPVFSDITLTQVKNLLKALQDNTKYPDN
jgi:mono/diheme cytochrome c family protein